MIRQLSKQDDDGQSTNDWVDSEKLQSTYFTASSFALHCELSCFILPWLPCSTPLGFPCLDLPIFHQLFHIYVVAAFLSPVACLYSLALCLWHVSIALLFFWALWLGSLWLHVVYLLPFGIMPFGLACLHIILILPALWVCSVDLILSSVSNSWLHSLSFWALQLPSVLCITSNTTALSSAQTSFIFSEKVSSCPRGTEVESLDITKAYRNSPIFPQHKKIYASTWKAVCMSNTSQLKA